LGAAPALPLFIAPMLAKPGEPFDSDQHLFEIKWDGTRTLAFIDHGGYRLLNRRRMDMTDRYPEFACLRHLPRGTVLDGKPDFHLLQSREQTRFPLKIRHLSASLPANYVEFDLLFESYQDITGQLLTVRREKLQRLVGQARNPRLVLSNGLVGQGKAVFREVCQQGLEGIVAKRLASRYLPGKRTDAWVKIKRRAETLCAIIGFIPSGANFRSLILATEGEQGLRCVGKVGTGFDTKLRQRLNRWLWSRRRPTPIVPCKIRGQWVQPGLCCRVSYLERTPSVPSPGFRGTLRRLVIQPHSLGSHCHRRRPRASFDPA
jgi:ATP-dependent DNA ligase